MTVPRIISPPISVSSTGLFSRRASSQRNVSGSVGGFCFGCGWFAGFASGGLIGVVLGLMFFLARSVFLLPAAPPAFLAGNSLYPSFTLPSLLLLLRLGTEPASSRGRRFRGTPDKGP